MSRYVLAKGALEFKFLGLYAEDLTSEQKAKYTNVFLTVARVAAHVESISTASASKFSRGSQWYILKPDRGEVTTFCRCTTLLYLISWSVMLKHCSFFYMFKPSSVFADFAALRSHQHSVV